MIKFAQDPKIQSLDFTPAESTLSQIKTDPMAGWLNVPVDEQELASIQQAATKIQNESDYLVCIGIGGSYLGHKAIIDALGQCSKTKILFAGNSLCSHHLEEVLETIGAHDFSINIISKSGTTLEPAIAFRILKNALIKKYGPKKATSRIYATTDANKGALHDEAVKNGYQRFVVPDNIGGRYSVLTAVGLLPLAVAGINIQNLLRGARNAAAHNFSDIAKYAITRQYLYQEENRETEIFASFEPRLSTFAEWWKQLFGESEGKSQQGIFPASVTYTTDLHSLGQYLQQGRRNIFETVIKFTVPNTYSLSVPEIDSNPASTKLSIFSRSAPDHQTHADSTDGLDYLTGKTLDEINATALEATIQAHRDGGIPVLEIAVPDFSEYSLGALIYFFELACAISAKISGVNPFDQPGVEAYKQNMFHLLGKPQN